MASAKQLAALKKGRETRARNLAKKNPAKRKKISVSAKSRTTGKTPTKRLKARRKANVKKGYYPNPKKRSHPKYVIFTRKGTGKKYYLQKQGGKYVWDTIINAGYTLSTAKRIGIVEGKKLPAGYSVYIEKK